MWFQPPTTSLRRTTWESMKKYNLNSTCHVHQLEHLCCKNATFQTKWWVLGRCYKYAPATHDTAARRWTLLTIKLLEHIRHMNKLPRKKNVHNSLMLYSSLHHTPNIQHDVQEIEGIRSLSVSLSPNQVSFNGNVTVVRVSQVLSVFIFLGWAPIRASQKIEYTGGCTQRTVFFSKRRKNSLFCPGHPGYVFFIEKPLGHIRCWIQTLLWQHGVYVVSVWSIVAHYPVSTHFSQNVVLIEQVQNIFYCSIYAQQWQRISSEIWIPWTIKLFQDIMVLRKYWKMACRHDGEFAAIWTTLEDSKPVKTNTMLDFSQNTKKVCPCNYIWALTN